MKGADFGRGGAGKALGGVLAGDRDENEDEIEADALEFEAQARKICEHLSPMLETQQQIVETLPEFKPYATMDPSAIVDCLDDTQGAGDAETAWATESNGLRTAARIPHKWGIVRLISALVARHDSQAVVRLSA